MRKRTVYRSHYTYFSLFSSSLFFRFSCGKAFPLPNNNEGKFAGLMGNDSVWYFTGAKLFPNVKGCGYPPMLNCSIFYRQYANIGQNFSCYYSKVDPGIVISDLDMWQVSGVLLYTLSTREPSTYSSLLSTLNPRVQISSRRDGIRRTGRLKPPYL